MANGDGNLDNKTIAKLAIAVAYATKLQQEGEVIGPLTRKVLEHLDAIDSLDHFASYTPIDKTPICPQ